LSLVASIFDMAIYPTLFVLYLTRLFPWFAEGHRGVMVGLAVVTVCAVMNIAGIRVVAISSLWLFFLLSAPFVLIVLIAPAKIGALSDAATAPTTSTVGLIGGLLICMWNYMGWDNASTIAAEVRRPQRTYPRAMILAVIVVALSYVLPFAAMWLTGVPSSAFETGSWAALAGMMGGLVGGPGRFVGGTGGRAAGGTRLPRRAGAGRDDERVWDVQRAGDELLAPAARDGAGWHAAGSLRQAAAEDACPMGRHRRPGYLLGHVPRPRIRATGHY